MPPDWTQSRVLLTGATGHTGRRLAAFLLERGATLRCLVHTPERAIRLPQSERVETVFGSASDPSDLARALEGVDSVLHLAHIRHAAPLVSALEKRFDPQRPARLIATSSTRLLSAFPSAIREVVRAGEQAIARCSPSVRWTILRPSMIFGGSDDNNLERMARVLRRSRLFPLFGAGRNLTQPIFVLDLVKAIVDCLDCDATVGKTYTLAGPEPMPYRQMAQAVARACGAKPPLFVRLPLRPSMTAARALRRLWPTSPLSPELVERFGEDRAFDIAPAIQDFGFKPTDFAKALEMKFSGKV